MLGVPVVATGLAGGQAGPAHRRAADRRGDPERLRPHRGRVAHLDRGRRSDEQHLHRDQRVGPGGAAGGARDAAREARLPLAGRRARRLRRLAAARRAPSSSTPRLIHELARRHIPAVLDSDGEPLRFGVEAEPFLVSPNQREAEALVGQEFHDDEDFQLGLDEIAELGARNVIITSESGCFALSARGARRRRFRAVAPRVEPVSRVGAGDALLAAFLAARVAGRSRRGCAAPGGRRRRRLDARARRRPLRPAPGPAGSQARRRGRRARRRLALPAGAEWLDGAPPAPTLASRTDASIGVASESRGADRGSELAYAAELDAELWLPEKFAKEGLTFDDVLLVPARVGRPARTTSRPRRG